MATYTCTCKVYTCTVYRGLIYSGTDTWIHTCSTVPPSSPSVYAIIIVMEKEPGIHVL